MKMCIICKRRPAKVPDRMTMGRYIKRVCSECHAERLRGDLREIIKVEAKRQAVIDAAKEEHK